MYQENRIPWMTYCLIGINVIVFLNEIRKLGLGVLMQNNIVPGAFLEVGAMAKQTVFHGGWFELISSQFVHFSFMNIFLNMWVLYCVGRDLESLIGPVKLLIFYLLTGLVGNIATLFLVNSSTVSAGASGAIMGLMGVMAIILLFKSHQFGIINGANVAKSYIGLLVLNIINGLITTGTNNVAHIFGAVAGIILGFVAI